MQAGLQLDYRDHAVFKALPAIFRDCNTEHANPKYELRYPQASEGYIYGSDGRILVRVKATRRAAGLVPDIAPNLFPMKAAAEYFGAPRGAWESKLTRLPSLGRLERCEHCKGEGHRPEHSCACEVFGMNPCEGRGVIPAGECLECEGTGIDEPREKPITLRPDVDVSAFYVHLLARHKARVYLPAEPNTPSSTRPVYFTVEGGVEGMHMPLAINSEEWKARGLVRPRRRRTAGTPA